MQIIEWSSTGECDADECDTDKCDAGEAVLMYNE